MTVPADSPFKQRIFHLDLRVQVMTPKALHRLVEELAALDYTGIIMEWEATFPYRRHATISNASAYTPAEVKSFLAHCNDLGLEVIPLQQCFGHVEYILRHPRYQHLQEDERDRCQFCARKIKGVQKLVRELLADLREFHSGQWLHLGGDETYLLGHCRECRDYAEKHGLARLYTEFMSVMLHEAKQAGFKPLIWADMLLKHPECIDLLPKDTVLIDWNYGWAVDRFGPPATLVEAGFEVWGAAALRSAPDNHSLTKWKRHLDNLTAFVPHARQTNYQAMILTSWSTSGIYGYEWDDGFEVTELLPLRRVYPLSGFRILLQAFAQAVDETTPFDSTAFVEAYGRDRFGLEAEPARLLAQALADRTSATRPLLSTLVPRRQKREFEHIVMTENFELLWQDFRAIADLVQSDHFDRAKAGPLIPKLRTVLERSNALEKRYRILQRDYLIEADIRHDSEYRQGAIRNLLAKLERMA